MVSEKILLTPGSVGSRVYYNGSKGTVNFIGNVDSLPGIWYGVDWDEPGHGKHDGTYEGKKYFSAKSNTSGSFVNVNKLNFGCTLTEALVDKYQKHELQSLDGTVWGNREVEFVGMEKISKKQSQVQKLRQIVLDDTLISQAGSNSLGKLLPNTVELHLCNTLLSDWNEILTISRQIPNLKYLNLSKNRLQKFGNSTNLSNVTLPGLKTLLLNATGVDWSDVFALANVFPNITELGLCKNSISFLTDVPYANLISLDLESNPINDWKEVLKLGTLPKLEILNLNETGIKSIELPSDVVSENKRCYLFKLLRILYLCGNKIDSWTSIDELDKLASLEHVLLHRNPVIIVDALETCRQIVIAKIGRLKILDRLEIVPQERRGAELDYLKRFGKQWFQAVGSGDGVLMEKFFASHPRYVELIKNDMTVVKLKGFVARLFSLDARTVRLFYECPNRRGTLIDIDNDFRKLDFYSLENGDTILVNALH